MSPCSPVPLVTVANEGNPPPIAVGFQSMKSLHVLLFVFVGLEISYTVDLDRVKTVSGTDSFRRMFFIDEETKEKVFVIKGMYNLTKQGESLCSTPRTVYLKVRPTNTIYTTL